MCFMLDPRDGQNRAFVQFPQRFDDVDPTDRYSNHNRVFFDATMLLLNGLQGPTYLGTGTMFPRVALYGMEPPRYRAENIKLVAKAAELGNSTPFLKSIPDGAIQERYITPVLVDEGLSNDIATLMTCAYEDGGSWGRDVVWVYNIATEDVVTGYRMHNRGWRSVYCITKRDAFRGTAPINLTDRLHQVLRWALGSVEIFMSRHCPLWYAYGGRLKWLERFAYTNTIVYPFTSVPLVAYCCLPAICLLTGKFIIPIVRFLNIYAPCLTPITLFTC